MKTFEQAQARVAKALVGTPDLVSGEGWEDATSYLVGVKVPDGDLVDRPAYVVNKRTGRLQKLAVIDNLDRLAAMKPMGGSVTPITGRRARRKR